MKPINRTGKASKQNRLITLGKARENYSRLRKSISKPTAADRFRNLNHHLWNNNGTWFIHYTLYPTILTKERQRYSLRTRDVDVARAARDVILEGLGLFHRETK